MHECMNEFLRFFCGKILMTNSFGDFLKIVVEK